MEFDDTRQVTMKMTASKKAVLVYDENGNTYMTSRTYLSNLLNGVGDHQLVKANFIGQTNPKRFNKHWDPSLIQKFDGDPLSKVANDFRSNNKVKVVGDDW